MNFKILFASIATALTVISYASNAHTRPMPTEITAVQQLTIHVTGRVTGWTNNKNKMYNGFYITTPFKVYLVKFAPRMGTRLRKAIKENMIVMVTGRQNLDCADQSKMSFESMEVNGERITDDRNDGKERSKREKVIVL